MLTKSNINCPTNIQLMLVHMCVNLQLKIVIYSCIIGSLSNLVLIKILLITFKSLLWQFAIIIIIIIIKSIIMMII